MIEHVLHTFEQFHASYVALLAMGLVLSHLGLFLVLRRQVFLGVALSQASAAGVALAFLVESQLGHGTALAEAFEVHGGAGGALAATIATALALDAAGAGRRVSREAILGVAYVLFGGAAVLLVWKSGKGLEELRNLLARDVLFVAPFPLKALLVGLALVAAVHLRFRRELVFVSFDAEMARTVGLPVRRLEAALALTLGVAIALSMRIAGALPVFAFLAVPPVAGLFVGRGLGGAKAIAAATAAGAAALGLAAAAEIDLPVAPTVACSVVAIAVVLAALAALGNAGRRVALAVAGLLAMLAMAALVVAVLRMVADVRVSAPRRDVSLENVEPAAAPTPAALLTALRHAKNPKVRAEAARGLARSSDREALHALVRALGDEDEDVAEAALLALQHDAARPSALDELSSALRADEPRLRLHASLALVALGDRRGLRGLIDFLSSSAATLPDKDEAIRALAGLTGGDRKGYDAYADDAANHKAVVAWDAWWRESLRRVPATPGRRP